MLGLAVAVALGLALPVAAESSDEQESKPDPVRLAKMLVRDGHYDRAQKELAKVDPASAEDLDQASYYTVSGIVALRNEAYETAVEQFDEAIRHGQVDDSIWVHLAQAHHGLQNWEKVVQMVRNADEAGREVPDLWLMRAEALANLDRDDEAWETLQGGRERFPDHRAMLRQQVFLAVELGLYREAMDLGTTYLDEAEGRAAPEDYIAVAQAFRRAGSTGSPEGPPRWASISEVGGYPG